MIVNYSKFAKLCNVTRQAIYKALNEGLVEKNQNNKIDIENETNINYMLSHGIGKIEAAEIILSWSKKKSKKETKKTVESDEKPEKKVIRKKKHGSVDSKKKDVIDENSAEITDEKFMDLSGLPAKMMKLSLKQLVIRYGGKMRLKDYADILNKMMMSAERDQKIQERRMDLIDKDFCVSKLFIYLENLSKSLFDFPEGNIDTIIALILSMLSKHCDEKIIGKLTLDLQKENIKNNLVNDMRKELGFLIEQTKNRIDRELESLLNKYEKDKFDE